MNTMDTGIREDVEPVVVRGDGVAVQRRRLPTEVTVARRHFGGRDLPAIITGALAASGAVTVLLAVAVAVAGSDTFAVGMDRGGAVVAAAALVVLVLCVYLGGWVTGRVARYDGDRNARWSLALFLLLDAGLLFLAGWRDGPGPRVRVDAAMDAPALLALVGGVVASIVLFVVVASLGGRRGTKYHEAADGMLLCIRDGDLRHLRKDRP